jgi:hypothetical protein
MQVISAQLLTLVSARESLQKQETLSSETDTDYSEESREGDEREPATEAGEASAQSRKYYMTFAEVSASTGLSILQLKRRAKAGAIEVNAAGKIRVKSLRNLHQNPLTKSRMVQSKPALSLVKKEVVNE